MSHSFSSTCLGFGKHARTRSIEVHSASCQMVADTRLRAGKLFYLAVPLVWAVNSGKIICYLDSILRDATNSVKSGYDADATQQPDLVPSRHLYGGMMATLARSSAISIASFKMQFSQVRLPRQRDTTTGPCSSTTTIWRNDGNSGSTIQWARRVGSASRWKAGKDERSPMRTRSSTLW